MKMSVVYFPNDKELEFSFEEDEKFIQFSVKVSQFIGDKVSEIVMPCVYHEMERDR